MKDQARASGRTRRLHERAFKDELIAQSLVPGASVAGIAMRGGINANLLFKWRRDHVRSQSQTAAAAAMLLPVCVIPDVEPTSTSQPGAAIGPAVNRGARSGLIEVEIAGALLRLRGPIDETALSTVLRALRHSA